MVIGIHGAWIVRACVPCDLNHTSVFERCVLHVNKEVPNLRIGGHDLQSELVSLLIEVINIVKE